MRTQTLGIAGAAGPRVLCLLPAGSGGDLAFDAAQQLIVGSQNERTPSGSSRAVTAITAPPGSHNVQIGTAPDSRLGQPRPHHAPQAMAARSRATRTICCIVVTCSARISCPAAVA